MGMDLLNSVSMPIYIASFVLLAYQYFKLSGAYFDIGLHFWLMAGALVLMFLNIFLLRRMLRAD